MPSGTVLVTGASTGIGEATVLHLRELGFDAVAGVRKDADAERLEGRGVRTVRIDVTDAGQIAAARDALGDGPLAGLVNNAGIAVATPLEFLPIDRLRQQLEINFIGQVAVTQAFLPALRRGHGRIVNVGAGARAGARRSPPRARTSRRCRRPPAAAPPGRRSSSGGRARARGRDDRGHAARRRAALRPHDRAAPRRDAEDRPGARARAGEVAETIGTALTAPRPRARYLVGRDAKLRGDGEAVPDRVMDRLIVRALRG